MSENVEIEGKAVIGFRLIINERIRAYQIQIKGSGSYPIADLETWIKQAKEKGEEYIPLYMGTVVDIRGWRNTIAEVVVLERRGFRAVGRGAKLFPKMVLDEYSENLEKMR